MRAREANTMRHSWSQQAKQTERQREKGRERAGRASTAHIGTREAGGKGWEGVAAQHVAAAAGRVNMAQ